MPGSRLLSSRFVRAGVFRGVERIEFAEIPAPEAGVGEVVIAVRACGICGSDLHAYREGSLLIPGQVMGHEFAGKIVQVGPQVRGLSRGDHVTVLPTSSCGACDHCRAGRRNLCPWAWREAIGFGRPGAFAEFVAVPDAVRGANVFVFGDELDFAQAAVTEPLAVAVHAVGLAGPVTGKTVLVLGLGPIGLLAVQVLRARGAARVVGVDLSPLRREVARAMGAEVAPGGGPLRETLIALLGPEVPIDVVLECSGAGVLLRASLAVVRHGGTVVMLALYSEPVRLNASAVMQKGLRLLGSLAYTPGDFASALKLLGSGAVRVEPLISHRVPLGEITEAFRTQLRADEAVKVMLAP